MLRPVNFSACSGTAGCGRLFLSAMPGRESPVRHFIEELRLNEVRHVLCLAADEEIGRKSRDYLEALNNNSIPAEVVRLPVPDYGLPASRNLFIAALSQVSIRWQAGESWVIHCAAGCGRTGMTAIMVLQLAGVELSQAQTIVEEAGSYPDTEEQLTFARI